MKIFFLKNKIGEKGVVLITALLVMSVILITSAGIAFVVIRGIRQSQIIDKSLVAYYAAESYTEEGLYQIRKNNLDIGDPSALGSLVNLSNGATGESELSVNDTEIKLDLPEHQTHQFSFYDQDKLNYTSNVAAINFSWNDCVGCLLEVSVTEFPSSGNPWKDATSKVKTIIFNTSSSYFSEFNSVGNPFLVRVKALKGNFDDLLIKFKDNLGGDLVIPNQVTLKTKGAYSNLLQTIQVKIPLVRALSGVFDYVIFTEEDINK